jgi:hypothetical protein
MRLCQRNLCFSTLSLQNPVSACPVVDHFLMHAQLLAACLLQGKLKTLLLSNSLLCCLGLAQLLLLISLMHPLHCIELRLTQRVHLGLELHSKHGPCGPCLVA